ncbi:tetraspanin-14 isoform X2 [Girardinichthys multiradiatus]|uniref:tetraspanin-14 isoform X2 n=1 Tax=Girardinichthys multiradiatus TaxID=208333 RepID=UPI001FABD63C|nr:tetraspanin-14 isoform X2 [Girardinichthys multiradiatus]
MYYYRYENAEVSCCYKYLMFSYNIIFWFSGVIGLIFFLELIVAVLAVVFQSQVREWINEFFLQNIKAYRDDIDLQNLIDSLQKMNHCCGAQEPNDWDLNVYFSCNGTHRSREKCGVPFSCCIIDPADTVLNTQCGYDVRNRPKNEWENYIFVRGCIKELEDWLPGNLYTVAIVFVVISLLQMVGIYLARTLISDIEKVKFSY